MSFAEKVRVKREELRLTQKELAERAGLTQATISRIEHGEVKQLKSKAVAALAKALKVTIEFLVGPGVRMGFEDTLSADETARVIFRGYERLPKEKREEVKNYVEFLLKKQKEESK